MNVQTILAIGQPQIHQAMKSIAGLSVVDETFHRTEVLGLCQRHMPDLLIISEMLQGKELGNLIPFLITIKNACPYTRIIYLPGQLDQTKRDDRLKVQTLIQHEIYDIYTQSQLSLRDLKQIIQTPKELEDLREWFTSESPFLRNHRNQEDFTDWEEDTLDDPPSQPMFSKRQQLDRLDLSSTIRHPERILPVDEGLHSLPLNSDLEAPLNRKRFFHSFAKKKKTERASCPKTKMNLPKISFDRKQVGYRFISLGMLLTGCFLIYTGIQPVLTLKSNTNNSVTEWEQTKQELQTLNRDQLVIEEYTESENIQEITPAHEGMYGLIQIQEGGKRIGLYEGTTNAILDQGAGFDLTMANPGEIGNAVIYGHREEVFWGLKDVKVGDQIRIETLTGDFVYQIKETFVTTPEDEKIYQDSESSMITLVTCYPFIYMGPTPERYVVVAEQIQN